LIKGLFLVLGEPTVGRELPSLPQETEDPHQSTMADYLQQTRDNQPQNSEI